MTTIEAVGQIKSAMKAAIRRCAMNYLDSAELTGGGKASGIAPQEAGVRAANRKFQRTGLPMRLVAHGHHFADCCNMSLADRRFRQPWFYERPVVFDGLRSDTEPAEFR